MTLAARLSLASSLGAACALFLFAAPVRAQDVRSCIESHGRMQELFGASKLLASREAAAACAAQLCPREVQADCDSFVKKVDAEIPRIVVRISGVEPTDRGFVEVDGEIKLSKLEVRPIRVDPGAHAVRVELEDGRTAQATVVLERAQTRDVEIRLPAATVSAGSSTSPDDAAESPTGDTTGDIAASSSLLSPGVLVAGGIGVAGILIGSYFGLQAISLKNDSDEHCPSEDRCFKEGIRLRDDADRAATISTIAFAVGIAGLGTALTLVVIAPSGSDEATFVSLQGAF